jgi:signal transduction histidine kinase
MSHELRTPLNAILGFTTTMLMGLPGPLNQEQTSQLQTVNTSGNHLLSLINDLLDLAQIRSGKAELKPEPINARGLGNSSRSSALSSVSPGHLADSAWSRLGAASVDDWAWAGGSGLRVDEQTAVASCWPGRLRCVPLVAERGSHLRVLSQIARYVVTYLLRFGRREYGESVSYVDTEDFLVLGQGGAKLRDCCIPRMLLFHELGYR